MQTQFTTKNGLILPLLNLRGKEYLQVAHRILWWRDENPTDVVSVDFITINETMCIAKATVSDQNGKVKAQMHKREDAKHFPDFMEKAETGAIGRALAVLGYGTQFTAQEFEEGERLADAPLAIDDISQLDSRKLKGENAVKVNNLEYIFSQGKLRNKTSLEVIDMFETQDDLAQFSIDHSKRNIGKSSYQDDLAQLRYLYSNFAVFKAAQEDNKND